MSDSPELLKPDTEVTESELRIELSNSGTNETFTVPDVEDIESLKEENEDLKRLLNKKSPLVLSDFYVELQKLREHNRELRLKIGEERRSSIVQISDLKRQLEGVTDSKLQMEVGNLRTENETLRTDYANVTDKLRQEVQELRSQLETERADREEIEAKREELVQLKKQVKEYAAELHREGRSIELEKDRWQGELSEARSELAAAKATIVQQRGKIQELERGYSLKLNPAERRLRLEIGELQTELADLKQKSATASELPEAADLLNQLKAKRKKSTTSLADIEAILEMIEEF